MYDELTERRCSYHCQSLKELHDVIPEFTQSKHGVVWNGVETPVLIIDDDTLCLQQWDGRGGVQLAMYVYTHTASIYFMLTCRIRARAFDYPIPPSLNISARPTEDGTTRVQGDAGMVPVTIDPCDHLDAIPQNCLYAYANDGVDVFEETEPEVQAIPMDTTFTSHGDPTAVLPERAPPEIDSLLLARDTGVPVSLIACRSSTIAPYVFPEYCGCAFLGFFFIRSIITTKVPLFITAGRS